MKRAAIEIRSWGPGSLWVAAVVALFHIGAFAQQLNQNCIATIANRSIQVNANGTFAVPNIPVDLGYYRVRVLCQNGSQTTQGQSAYFMLVANGNSKIPPIVFGTVTPPPISISLSASTTAFTAAGQTTQLKVTGTLTNGTQADLSTQALGTLYLSSNPKIATVSANGLVTAVGLGTVIITARNEGAASTLPFSVNLPLSTVGDGIPDTWKIQYGFSVTDPGVASADPDNDGLTNLQEYKLGTNPLNPDTDGDGVPDGKEVQLGTNPLNPDTDGDGLSDGQELLLGTNPLNKDTDGDGIPDGTEVALGTNPLVPDPTTTVQGRVLNSNLPVAGASVVLFGLITGVTDGTGFFSVSFVPADIGPVTAIARVTINNVILEGESNPVSPTGAVTNVGVIQLGQSNGGISGVVTNVQGTPVANAQVKISIGAESRTTSTNSGGLYAFSGFTPNSFVVTAIDPVTGLNGQTSGYLFANSSAVANIQLTAAGAIKGTVFATDGITPVANASVVLSGTSLTTTTTNVAGQFTFTFVSVGAFTLDATDSNGNHGRSTGTIPKTGSIVQSDVAFLGRGTVSGIVTDSSQNPVASANISLTSKSLFGGVSTTTTDSNGNYSLPNIFVGPFNVAASSSALQLGGQASSSITSDQQTVTANITLGASGTVTGTIFHADGVTPDPYAQVNLSDGATTQADANGLYTLSFVPVGTYTISVSDLGTGDQGTGTVTIGGQGDLQTVNINLNGQGNVTVTVIDALTNPVANGIVTLTGQTQFGGAFNGVTQANGTYTFSQVPAGSFAVTATDPVTQAGAGPVSGSVSAGNSASVTLQLQPVGAVTGFVFAANGVTPVSGITVNLVGAMTQTTISAFDGSFSFNVVPSGTYSLQGLDGNNTVRATASVTVVSAGSTVTQNLVLVGFGTVTGTVTVGGFPASDATVTLTDASGKVQSAATGSSGAYSIFQVAVGPFTEQAVLESGNQVESGFAQGQMTGDGATVNENIALVGQTQVLPATLVDANSKQYQLRQDGSLYPGDLIEFFSAFSSLPQGGMQLDLISGGNATHFAGNTTAVTVNNGREFDIQQQGVAGLNITRKIYVPVDGYFVRYLEVLQNPGTTPVTIGLRWTTTLRFTSARNGARQQNAVPPAIVTTSSGDNVLEVAGSSPDNWAVFQDTSVNFIGAVTSETLPPVADVFDGPAAVLPATSAQWTIDNANRQGTLQEEFDNITVPAGGQVALLHFLSLQVNVPGAIASAQRLVQLPPEGLAGIASSDLPTILNFAVPANGVSTVSLLESLTGQVIGRVTTGDGVTGIPGAAVSFLSNDPLFGATLNTGADPNGNYTFIGQFSTESSTPVPVTGFVVQATDPNTRLQSAATPGSFPAGHTIAQQNIVLSGGSVTGTVYNSNGQVLSAGSVSINSGGYVPVSIAANGTYSFVDIGAGTYTLTANLPTNQNGPPLSGTAVTTVVPGQTNTVNIAIEPPAALSGVIYSINGTPFPSLTVELDTSAGYYQTVTDSAGNFSFTEIQPGTAMLEAYDSVSQSGAGAQITLLPNQTSSQNLNLVQGTGSVTGVVTESGNPVAGAQVTVTTGSGGGGGGGTSSVFRIPAASSSLTPGASFTTTAGSDGSYSVSGVPIGPVTVSATDPNSGAAGQSTGFVPLPGTPATVNVSVQIRGSWNFGPGSQPGSDDRTLTRLFDIFDPGMVGWDLPGQLAVCKPTSFGEGGTLCPAP